MRYVNKESVEPPGFGNMTWDKEFWAIRYQYVGETLSGTREPQIWQMVRKF